MLLGCRQVVRHWLSEHQAVRDNQHEFQLEPDEDIFNNVPVGYSGMSPSGKALGSGSSIRGFESLHPSQVEKISPERDKLESLGSESDPVTGVVF